MDEEDIGDLKTRALSRRRIKTNLIEHQEMIKKMMDADISLPLIYEWLSKKNVETALTTLRRFVRRTFGETYYNDFSHRNGWHKKKQVTSLVRPGRAVQQSATTAPSASSKQQVGKSALGDPADINNFFNHRRNEGK